MAALRCLPRRSIWSLGFVNDLIGSSCGDSGAADLNQRLAGFCPAEPLSSFVPAGLDSRFEVFMVTALVRGRSHAGRDKALSLIPCVLSEQGRDYSLWSSPGTQASLKRPEAPSGAFAP